MTDIKRYRPDYDCSLHHNVDGKWVTHADHIAALEAVKAAGVTEAQYEHAADRLSIAVEGVLDGLSIDETQAREIMDFVLTETFGRAPSPALEAKDI